MAHLHGRITGRGLIEPSLYRNMEEANAAMMAILDEHAANGRRASSLRNGRQVWYEVTDNQGNLTAKYWVSDDKDSPEPQAP